VDERDDGPVMSLRRDEGFTLMEMIVAMAIAMIVSLAAFGLVETVMKRTGEVSARVEATQRARGAMDDMTRELRSQVCVIRSDPSLMSDARTVYSASATQIVFFGDLSDESFKTASDTIPIPTLRTLTFTPGAGATGTITETIRPGVKDTTVTTVDAISYSTATNDKKRTLLTNVEQLPDPLDGSKVLPVFRYWTYDTAKSPTTATKELLPGGGSLSAADLASLAKITVSYRVRAVGKLTQRISTPLVGEIFLRTVDPNIANPQPICL
jgi:prepilin-type N-terminal cleavage/methylation domain-containing protein